MTLINMTLKRLLGELCDNCNIVLIKFIKQSYYYLVVIFCI